MMAWKVKNNGSAEWRGSNSCRVEFQVENTDTHTITRERKTFYVSARTKAEKGRCIREFRIEIENRPTADEIRAAEEERKAEEARRVTFAEYASQWLVERTADPQIAQQTVTKNRRHIANINLSLGDKPISDITRADVKRFQAAIMTAGPDGKAPTVSGRPLAGSTARCIRVTLKAVLQEAVRDGVINRNPCEDVKAPKCDTREKKPLTPEDAARFCALLDSAEPRPSLVAFRLMLFAGLRRSEAVAVRWRDFDSEAGRLTVCRSLCTETLKFKDTKTEAGRRTIPLDPGTVAYLKAFRAAQATKLLALRKNVADACICAEAGAEYMHPENLSRSLRRFAKTNDFPGVTPHILRHTYCTLLFAAGTDLKTTQYLMGHSDPATTLRVYTHYMESKGVEAARAVGALMDSLPTSNVVTLSPHASRWGIRARSA